MATFPTHRLDLKSSIHSLISLVHHHLSSFLSNPSTRHAVHRQCLSRLCVPDHGPVLLTLCNAISEIEKFVSSATNQLQLTSTSQVLEDIEKMLQMPALLEEDGEIAGISNKYIVSCAYLYLALVRKMQGDQWQMTVHLLHSVLVLPEVVREELAVLSELWKELFGVCTTDEAARLAARKYKDWLMYYKVVSHGESRGFSVLGDAEAETSNGRCTHVGRHASSLLKSWPIFSEDKMEDSIIDYEANTQGKSKAEQEGFAVLKDLINNSDGEYEDNARGRFESRCLQDMLEESHPDSPISFYSHGDSTEASDTEMVVLDRKKSAKVMPIDPDLLASKLANSVMIYAPETPHLVNDDVEGMNSSHILSSRSHGSLNNPAYSNLDFRHINEYCSSSYFAKEEAFLDRLPRHELRCFSTFSSRFMQKNISSELSSRGSRKFMSFSNSKDCSDISSCCGKDSPAELAERFENAVSTLCLSEGLGSYANAIWELLNTDVKHKAVRQDILEQLLDSISTSKQDRVIRASVYLLLLMISEDKTIVRDIKRKGLHLLNLANALKRNVHEAAILIYLLDPSPSEIKNLELLPSLLHVACNSDTEKWSTMLPLTPSSASVALIELLVTAFDYVTNNIHLASISSPQILSKLGNVAKNNNLEECVALAAILVRCVRLNGNCKKFLSRATPVEPFIHLLRRKETDAKCAALDYFHEILRIPRSHAIQLLHEIRQQGGTAIMHTLMACIHQTEPEHQLLASNLLLQLDMLENSNHKSIFKEEAMEVLVKCLSSEDNYSVQALAASVFSNLGGTYSWTGESYTAASLVKKAGLTSTLNKNMIRNIEWLDPCLQDLKLNAWSTKIACGVIKVGSPLLSALAKGIRSKMKSTSRDCLISAAWLGNEMAILGQNSFRYTACEMLLDDVVQYLHPGSEHDERILACFCMYNYTSGKGKQKLMDFSESLRESLRRLSSVTWMAEELLRVTDYFLPSKPRVSCVHTQILEVGQASTAAATAIVFFRGQLVVGYSDGNIRTWDIKGQRAVLVREVQEHKKEVTCFALFEQSDYLLSGSSDKSIRVWNMVQKKLECVEVIQMKAAVRKLDTNGDKIIIITQHNGLKLSYASRSIQSFCKSKNIKSLAVAQGKAYLGCDDFSIQEVDILVNNKIEIRPPARSWRIKKQFVNAVVVYKDWMYCAGSLVEGSSLKDWRRRFGPKITMAMPKGTDIQAMAVVEDFIYLNCSKSSSIVQIWLREKQQQVGRLSAGSKITSVFTANDIIFCGTETGLIKAWIPL